MLRRSLSSIILASVLLLVAAGCRHAKVTNPIANVDSKQPDKVLFDRAMEAMKGAKYVVARTLLETLINTYPDSEYVARAKLSVGDSWYAEGTKSALQQAEAEYKDFITFFPNLPEAAEAQLKIGNIHYRQMEKADRDYTDAMRAEDEYKNLLTQFPNSPLVPQAKQKLRDVQEVLAQRQYNIARFYFLRDNLAASQARYRSLIDSYPLYSGIDEALFSLGGIYEREAKAMAATKLSDALKEKITAEYEKKAIEAYSLIITRYPAMGRADDARKQLADLKAPIPVPTPEALAQSKAEQESRGDIGRFRKLVDRFKRHPDMSPAVKTGEPSMNPPTDVSAVAIMKELENRLKGPAPSDVSVEPVKGGSGTPPGPNQPPPNSTNNAQPATGNGPTPAPQRTNDIQNSSSDAPNSAQPVSAQPGTDNAQGKDSTSQKKKKKGLRKLVPF
jgi:outer membrane protein assembly factor BamD